MNGYQKKKLENKNQEKLGLDGKCSELSMWG